MHEHQRKEQPQKLVPVKQFYTKSLLYPTQLVLAFWIVRSG